MPDIEDILKLYITADVILLKAARNFASQFDISKVCPSRNLEYGTISDIRIFWSEKFDVKIIREK